MPDCLRQTPRLVGQVGWLPSSCSYKLRAAGKPLAEWHYLVSGDPSAVHRQGPGVAGRVVSETEAGPLEHHIVDWVEDEEPAA